MTYKLMINMAGLPSNASLISPTAKSSFWYYFERSTRYDFALLKICAGSIIGRPGIAGASPRNCHDGCGLS
jgi:hypothetical protein